MVEWGRRRRLWVAMFIINPWLRIGKTTGAEWWWADTFGKRSYDASRWKESTLEHVSEKKNSHPNVVGWSPPGPMQVGARYSVIIFKIINYSTDFNSRSNNNSGVYGRGVATWQKTNKIKYFFMFPIFFYFFYIEKHTVVHNSKILLLN